MVHAQSLRDSGRQLGSELRYKAIDEVANSHPALSYTLLHLDLDFIPINENFNTAKIFLMIIFFLRVCDTTVEIVYGFAHGKAEQLRSKPSVFILLEHRIVTF